jgi:hypothetical protein
MTAFVESVFGNPRDSLWLSLYAVGLVFPIYRALQLWQMPRRDFRIVMWGLAAVSIVGGITLSAWTAVTSPDATLVISFFISVATFGAAWGCIGLVIHTCKRLYERVQDSARSRQ